MHLVNGQPHPDIGDAYYPDFESDFEHDQPLPAAKLTIQEVLEDTERDGFTIIASDDVGYDCFWSERYKSWIYGLVAHETY